MVRSPRRFGYKCRIPGHRASPERPIADAPAPRRAVPARDRSPDPHSVPPLSRSLTALLRAGSAVAVATAWLAAGCAQAQLRLSEEETGAVLDDLQRRVDAERAAARERAEPPPSPDRETPEVPAVVGIEDALRIAHRYNRGLRTDREGLVFSALTLLNARRDVGPRVAGSVASVVRGTERGEDVRSHEAALSLLGLLPTGADVEVTGRAGRDWGRGDGRDGLDRDTSVDGSLTARVSQPLLAGRGAESAYESLTDAERQALYDVRDFELARQDLSLRVQREYYGIVAQKRVVRNREAILEQFEFLKRRSETLFSVDRVSEVDKFRAAREYLTAQNSLVDAKQELAARLDRFKVLLGIETATTVEVAEEIPEVKDEDYDLKWAIDVALANRLELRTARDQVDDAERRVRIRTQELQPDLRLVAERSRSARPGERHTDDLDLRDDGYSVSLELELPLDRVRERASLRRARIELVRGRRALAQLEDDVILSVRESLRELRSAANSLAIQREIAASEEKNSKVARMRFENGEIGNRDLTDAQNSLVDAQDRLVREQVNVELARVQLLRDLGVLRLAEDGTWIE